jgi:hypothetical protein
MIVQVKSGYVRLTQVISCYFRLGQFVSVLVS